MKSCRTRTLRGSFLEPLGDLKRELILDDGRLNHGLKIISFKMWTDLTNPDVFISASLSLDVTGPQFFDAADNQQIAWFTVGYLTNNPNAHVAFPITAYIDPDHIVNESLYLRAYATPNVRWNYLIECEEYELTDDEAVMTLIKERSQNFE